MMSTSRQYTEEIRAFLRGFFPCNFFVVKINVYGSDVVRTRTVSPEVINNFCRFCMFSVNLILV
jgi:hypothetical protein